MQDTDDIVLVDPRICGGGRDEYTRGEPGQSVCCREQLYERKLFVLVHVAVYLYDVDGAIGNAVGEHLLHLRSVSVAVLPKVDIYSDARVAIVVEYLDQVWERNLADIPLGHES